MNNTDKVIAGIYSDYKNALISYIDAIEQLQECGVWSKDAEQMVCDWNDEELENK